MAEALADVDFVGREGINGVAARAFDELQRARRCACDIEQLPAARAVEDERQVAERFAFLALKVEAVASDRASGFARRTTDSAFDFGLGHRSVIPLRKGQG
jgi:hypothetical protein